MQKHTGLAKGIMSLRGSYSQSSRKTLLQPSLMLGE